MRGPGSSPKFLIYWISLGLLSVISSKAAAEVLTDPLAGAGGPFLLLLTGSSDAITTASSPSIWISVHSLKKPVSLFTDSMVGVVASPPTVSQLYLIFI